MWAPACAFPSGSIAVTAPAPPPASSARFRPVRRGGRREAALVCRRIDRPAGTRGGAGGARWVRRRLAAGEAVVPGFRADGCRVIADRELSCGDHWGRASFIHWPDLDTCRGITAIGAQPPVVPGPGLVRNRWSRVYRAGSLRIEYGM